MPLSREETYQLSEMGKLPLSELNPYWLGPFINYKTFCPCLVGSYERVAAELSRYIALDYRTFILDIPPVRKTSNIPESSSKMLSS